MATPFKVFEDGLGQPGITPGLSKAKSLGFPSTARKSIIFDESTETPMKTPARKQKGVALAPLTSNHLNTGRKAGIGAKTPFSMSSAAKPQSKHTLLFEELVSCESQSSAQMGQIQESGCNIIGRTQWGRIDEEIEIEEVFCGRGTGVYHTDASDLVLEKIKSNDRKLQLQEELKDVDGCEIDTESEFVAGKLTYEKVFEGERDSVLFSGDFDVDIEITAPEAIIEQRLQMDLCF